MYNRMIVKEALKRTLDLDFTKRKGRKNPATDQNSVISMLIHDIFGGEILKTPEENGWYFYNRIDGESVDFSGAETEKSNYDRNFADLPASPDETSGYFDRTDYLTFYMRFVRAFEETLGLGQSSSSVFANA
jgi:hypothetical protein